MELALLYTEIIKSFLSAAPNSADIYFCFISWRLPAPNITFKKPAFILGLLASSIPYLTTFIIVMLFGVLYVTLTYLIS